MFWALGLQHYAYRSALGFDTHVLHIQNPTSPNVNVLLDESKHLYLQIPLKWKTPPKKPNTELFRRQNRLYDGVGYAECSGPELLRSAHLLDSELKSGENVRRKRGSLCFALQVCYSELAGPFVFSARHTRSGAAPNRTGGLPGSLDTSPGWETIIQRQCWWHGSWHLSDTLIRRRGGSPVARC